jgi:predicted RNA-binding Zn-ribbon protein involved in translation (DUF1610 family)
MKSPKIVFKKNPQFAKCPSCGEFATLHKSKARSPWEQFVKRFTPFKYYRCKKCGWRGSVFTYKLTKTSFKNLAGYLFVALIVAYLVKVILKMFILK